VRGRERKGGERVRAGEGETSAQESPLLFLLALAVDIWTGTACYYRKTLREGPEEWEMLFESLNAMEPVNLAWKLASLCSLICEEK
jgi:hypothetical protein